MKQPGTISRLAAWLALFGSGASWIGVLACFGLFTGASYAISLMVADPSFAYGIGGPFTFLAASVVQFAFWALIALFLARRLGDGPPRTAWGTWLLLALAYFLVGIVPPGLAQGFIAARLQDDPQLTVSAATGFNLFWNAAVFPLLVWLAAAGHGARGAGPRAIWTYLTGGASGLWGLYIAVLLASLLIKLGMDRVAGGEVTTFAELLLQQLVNSVRAVATVLFAIMAYREIRAARPPA